MGLFFLRCFLLVRKNALLTTLYLFGAVLFLCVGLCLAKLVSNGVRVLTVAPILL